MLKYKVTFNKVLTCLFYISALTLFKTKQSQAFQTQEDHWMSLISNPQSQAVQVKKLQWKFLISYLQSQAFQIQKIKGGLFFHSVSAKLGILITGILLGVKLCISQTGFQVNSVGIQIFSLLSLCILSNIQISKQGYIHVYCSYQTISNKPKSCV